MLSGLLHLAWWQDDSAGSTLAQPGRGVWLPPRWASIPQPSGPLALWVLGRCPAIPGQWGRVLQPTFPGLYTGGLGDCWGANGMAPGLSLVPSVPAVTHPPPRWAWSCRATARKRGI